jgi:RNA polymerase sigma-70 factor (ECF subfamily)
VIDPAARSAWRELEAKLRSFVARRVRSGADVDDVVQDVFLRIQRGIGGLRDKERFGPWIYQVARSAIAEHRRALARHPLADGEAREKAAPQDEDDASVQPQVALYVARRVATLPSPHREALTLTELEGLTQREAASMLGVSLSAMKSRVRRGRRQVRAALEECCRIVLDARRQVISCEPHAGSRPVGGCCDHR